MTRPRTTTLMPLFALGLLLGACAAPAGAEREPGEALRPISAASLKPGQPVPAPNGERVLEITGAVGTRNGKDGLALDLATLERLEVVGTSLFEPFVKERHDFSAVRMSDLLDVAGVGTGAQWVNLEAIDDYKVRLSTADIRAHPILLATRMDGKPIAVEDGGPIRIIFPDGVAMGADHDLWIWSVRSMVIG